MRVIAGTARGRRLFAPKGRATRPTPDRVREALFSVLGGRLDDLVVLDLFAGSGAMGIEALSRGAKRAVFVDQDKEALAVLERNVGPFEPSRLQILGMDAERAVRLLASRRETFDVVFLDPPFASDLLAWAVRTLAASTLLANGAVVVCEHASDGAPPDTPVGLVADPTRRYGTVSLTLLHRAEAGGVS